MTEKNKLLIFVTCELCYYVLFGKFKRILYINLLHTSDPWMFYYIIIIIIFFY